MSGVSSAMATDSTGFRSPGSGPGDAGEEEDLVLSAEAGLDQPPTRSTTTSKGSRSEQTRSSQSGSYRYNRARFRGSRMDSADEEIEFDSTKSAQENVVEVLKQVVAKTGVSKGRKVANLNALVRFWDVNTGMPLREVLLCLRIPLTHELTEVRAAALRTIRCLVRVDDDAVQVYRINAHYLIARCLDIDLDNKAERIHALRLIRKLLYLAPDSLPDGIIKCLIALAIGNNGTEDQFRRTSLAILCELSILSASRFIVCGGVNVFESALLDCSMPKISDALIGCLLRLHNDPDTRSEAGVCLDLVVAPFTEFSYVQDDSLSKDNFSVEMSATDSELRFQSSRIAILSMIRSWTGLLLLCDLKRQNASISPLNAIINTLLLKHPKIREEVLSILYDALVVRSPKDTDCFYEALGSVIPAAFREQWKLAEGFVAAEGAYIVPNMIKSRPNVQEIHRSLLIHCLLKNRLPDALIEVIVTSEANLSVRATILLGEFLHLACLLLPRELNALTHCLPTLLLEVSSSDRSRSIRASEAVHALEKLHDLKKQGPSCHSLFLDQIFSSSWYFHNEKNVSGAVGERMQSPAWSQIFKKSISEHLTLRIDDSRVLREGEEDDATWYSSWRWDVIEAVFKWPSDSLWGLDTTMSRQFVRRVVDFYRPSASDAFIKLELNESLARRTAQVGCTIMDFLVRGTSEECTRILNDFLLELKEQFNLLISSVSPHDCLFSPTKIASTARQYYFLFIGRLSRSQEGRRALDRHNFLQSFFEMLSMRSDMYLKLVVTCLDYSSLEWGSRNVLGKACRESNETGRLYATRLIGVLIRCRTPNIAQWGIDLLVNQLFDKSKVIPWVALDLLDEACDDKMNLEAVVCALTPKEPLTHLGFRGVLMLTHFVASASGFKYLSDTGMLHEQLKLWSLEYNVRYVATVEEILNDGFSRHQHNDERVYGRRSYEAYSVQDCFLPPHLYGQLATRSDGLRILAKEEALCSMFAFLRNFDSTSNVTPSEQTTLKAAVWATSNVAKSHEGALLCAHNGAVNAIIDLAGTFSSKSSTMIYMFKRSPHFSIRGTAFYAIGMIAMTKCGADILQSRGWYSIKHNKEDKWPVTVDWLTAHLSRGQGAPAQSQKEETRGRSSSDGQGKKEKDPESSPLTQPDESVSPMCEQRSISKRSRLTKMFRSFSLGTSRKSPSGKSWKYRSQQIFKPKGDTEAAASSTPKKVDEGKEQSDGKKPDLPAEEDQDVSIGTAPIATPEEGDVDAVLTNIVEETPSANLDDLADLKVETGHEIDTVGGHETQAPALVPKIVYTLDQAHRLSPIASATSLSTMKEQQQVSESQAEGSIHPDPQQVDEGAKRKRATTRSGQRAFSESEAHNIQQEKSDRRLEGDDRYASLRTNQEHLMYQKSTTNRLHLGHSFSSVASSSGSWSDNPAFHTMRSLQSRRRPALTHSDSGGGDTLESANAPPSMFSSGTSIGDQHHPRHHLHYPHLGFDTWSRKTRSLDHRLSRQHSSRLFVKGPVPLLGQQTGFCRQAKPVAPFRPNDTQVSARQESGFWGISLPLSLEILCPSEPSQEEAPSRDESTSQESSKGNRMVREWLQFHPHIHGQGLECHIAWNCLACFRLMSPPGSKEQSSPDRKRSGSMSASITFDVENASPPAADSPSASRRTRKESLIGSEESLRGGSTQSLKSDLTELKSSDSLYGKLALRKEVIRMVGNMNVRVGIKTVEDTLLRMRQKHPNLFTDLCLYSEVCLLMAKYRYRASTRRFLQELFMNLQFDDLYVEPSKILGLSPSEEEAAAPAAAQLGQLKEATASAERLQQSRLSSNENEKQ